MRHLAISALVMLCCVGGALAQEEVKVVWSSQVMDVPPDPFYQLVGSSEPSTVVQAVARWAGWDKGERLDCTSTGESLRAVALRENRTWTLVLWNSSDQKSRVAIEGYLPAGVYTVERLLMADGGGITLFERRNGLRQSAAGKVSRTEWLNPRSGMVLRFVERVQTAEEGLGALRRAIWQSHVSPGVLSRLAGLMREMDNHWYQVRASLRKNDVRMAARGVHRMLFLASGVRVASSKYPGTEQVAILAESLIDALSELDSAILNIVVTVRCEGERLEAQVANAGTQVWKALRIASNVGTDEPVVLANMKPMERAEASFKLKGELPLATVNVSVLFNGGYARLRVGCILPEEEKEVEG
ncbi:MAG: hypothetical protein HPY54_07740 [Chthonomonadetes bacterium]|nr:hypothetical protein [Chthonomonadetes bacterium]